MKGILLAGGRGTRLYPLTRAVSKQLLPIYDKPMVYYPLSVLMTAGARDILLVTNPGDAGQFRALLGGGERLGVKIRYAVQPFPLGIADALRIGEEFLEGQRCILALGDNLFVGGGLETALQKAAAEPDAAIFTVPVKRPEQFGVAEVLPDGTVCSLEEKPRCPRSNLAVPGLYFYPPDCAARAKTLRPSARGELEITDLNRQYLQEGRLKAIPLAGVRWLDTGTCEGLLAAVNLVAQEQKAGRLVGCVEEIALQKGYISREDVARLSEELSGCEYGQCLRRCL